MLYTRKGDKGTTKTFACNQSISKSSAVAEALGTLDEINSYLGLIKIKADLTGMKYEEKRISDIVYDIQNNLFIIQAEVAGADKTILESKVKDIEKIVDGIEKAIPPINSFFISGGTELTANIDFARTLSRRAERRVVEAYDEGSIKIGDFTLSYLNRLSSLLYALARFVNFKNGIIEDKPNYN
jgi:cob(I)alamin adenosyltransferase